MKKIIAFGASSSKDSINKQLAAYAAGLFENASVEILDLNDYEMPIFSIDAEAATGIPALAADFYNKLGTADLLVISFAEHNGAYSAAFKNIFDWISRIHAATFQEKQTLIMAKNRLPFQGANVKGSFSLPSFNDNFDSNNGITNKELNNQLFEIIKSIDL
jgi:chromate reductase